MKVPAPRKLPSGNWFVQLRLGGESISITEASERECKRRAMLVKAEYLAGKRERKDGKLPTLSEAIDQYIASKSNILSPSTIRGYRVIQRNRFKALMSRPLSEIGEADWVSACNEEAALCSAKTLVNAWRFLVSVVKAVTKKSLPEVTLPQIVPNERPFLDAAQIKIFLSAIQGNEYKVPMLLALSSLRYSEILGLTWENIDLNRRRIHVKGAMVLSEHGELVRKAENKNRSSTRYVPILMDELYQALIKVRKDQGPVVSMPYGKLRKEVNVVCKEAGLPLVGVHGLRHSFASLAYHLGVPEKITMEIGGWSDNQTMRKIYTHIAQSDMQRYQDQFKDFFSNANGKVNG